MAERAHHDSSILTPDVDPTAQAEPIEPAEPPPDLARTGESLTSIRSRSAGVTILAVLALLYTLYFARDFLLPIVIALLLDLLFSPVVRALTRVRVPAPIGAAIVVVGLLGVAAVAAYELAAPVQRWVAEAPETLATAREKLGTILRPLERVQRTAEQVQSAASGTVVERAPEVVVRGPSIISRVFGTTQRFASSAVQVIILLYFLLAAGDLFLQKLIKVLPLLRDKKKAVMIARETEASISTYLFTVALVNIGLGILVTLVMMLVGMPNAVLWGSLAAVAEFVPYLGATVMLVLLTMAGLVNFESVGQALLVPGAYLAVNLIQANFVSPMVLGRRLTLNPVAILVGLVFWFWIWGVGGAFIAVPLLATFKIFCDHIESLAPIGEFLGK